MGQRPERVTRHDRGQKVAALRGGAELRDQRSGDDRGLGKGLDHEAAAKFLHDDEGLLDAFGETARLGRDRGGQEAEFCHLAPDVARPSGLRRAIGRASCREIVCQYVSISLVAVSLKKKKKKKKS